MKELEKGYTVKEIDDLLNDLSKTAQNNTKIEKINFSEKEISKKLHEILIKSDKILKGEKIVMNDSKIFKEIDTISTEE